MAGMTDKDHADVAKRTRTPMPPAQTDTRKTDELLKLTSQDKDMSKRAKAANEAYNSYHKAGRVLLDAVNAKT